MGLDVTYIFDAWEKADGLDAQAPGGGTQGNSIYHFEQFILPQEVVGDVKHPQTFELWNYLAELWDMFNSYLIILHL